MSVQSLVDATIRHLEWRVSHPAVKHRRLEVRVHECNIRTYAIELGKRLAALLGEPDRVIETPSDGWSVVVKFNAHHRIDFNYVQQVYMNPEHAYVEYESDDRCVMLFDCTMQIPNDSQLQNDYAQRIANLEL